MPAASGGRRRSAKHAFQEKRRAADDVQDAVRTHETFLRTETLADKVFYRQADQSEPGGFTATVGDGAAIEVAVHRI